MSYCSCPRFVSLSGDKCIVCERVAQPPLSDEDVVRCHTFEAVLSRNNINRFEIVPEDLSEEEYESMYKTLWTQWWETKTITSEDVLRRRVRETVFSIVYDAFSDEYGELLEQIEPYMPINEAYSKRVKLGRKEFHKFLKERLVFKAFCERFYVTLRQMYNVGMYEMEEEFQKMRKNEWSFDDYSRDLKKSRKS